MPTQTEVYRGTVRFFRGYDATDDDPAHGNFWRGLRKARHDKRDLDLPQIIAYEREDDQSIAVFWAYKMKRLALKDRLSPSDDGTTRVERVQAHEFAHGPNGAPFPLLSETNPEAGDRRGRDGGLSHVKDGVPDLMNAMLDPKDPDPRGIVTAYRKAVQDGNVKRVYEGGPI